MSAKRNEKFKRKARTARSGPRFSMSRPSTIRKFTGARPVARTRRTASNIRTAGFLGIEHKFYDTFLKDRVLTSSATATGGVHDPSVTSMISTPPQGTNASSRDGKKIVIESIQISGRVIMAEKTGLANLDTVPTIFIALVEDHQSNGAQMSSQEAFVNPSASLSLTTHPFKSLLRSARFTTHKVWMIEPPMPSAASFGGVNSSQMMGQQVSFDLFKKVQIPVNFNGGTTADIANVVDNSLHIIAWSSDTSWPAIMSYNARIRFVG